MSRIYRIPYTGTLTAAGTDVDLALLLPADDKPIALAGFVIGQTSRIGDAQEEILRITIRHFAATITNGTGGSAPTPATSPNQPAAGFTCRVHDTTVATTSGTGTILEELSWNIRNTPWDFYIEEKMREGMVARQGEGLIVRMETTPGQNIVAGWTVRVEEF